MNIANTFSVPNLSGYGLIGGANPGLDIAGHIQKDKNGIAIATINLLWNDRTDANLKNKDDYGMLASKKIQGVKDNNYDIKIQWEDQIKIVSNKADRK